MTIYGGCAATAAIHYPDTPAKEPLILVVAAKGSGLEIFPYIAVDENCALFQTAPDYYCWRNRNVQELRTSALDKDSAKALRTNTLAKWLDSASVDFTAVTANKTLSNRLPFTSCRWGWRGEAQKLEADLRESGRLFVNFNPAFEWLRSVDEKGAAQECYLQAIYLASRLGLHDLSPEEKESAYMEEVMRYGAKLFTFKW